ncbi:serine/threonine-protein phosphatase [Acidobacteria bacterium AB60]|nr:serine/threonine-protein phosphatase [Acidobacteria bacterium AB60]
MKRLLLLAPVVVILAIAQAACGQSAPFVAPEHCVFRPGDDVRWAAAPLDESAWQPASQWSEETVQEPSFWLRCTLNPAELALDIQPVLQVSGNAAYEIYLDGQFLARTGNVRTGDHTEGILNQYSSPALAARGRLLQLAVRISFSPTVYGQQPLPSISLGDPHLLRDRYEAATWNAVRSRWIIWVCNALMATAGLFFLALYLFDRSQLLLLWTALTWIGLVIIRFTEFLVTASVHFPSRLEYLLYSLGNTDQIFYILFFFALTRRKINPLFRGLLWFQIVYSSLLVVVPFLPLRAAYVWRYWVDVAPAGQNILIPLDVITAFAPLAAFWPITKLPRSQLVLFAVCSSWMAMDVLYLGAQFPPLPLGQFYFLTFQTVRSIAIAAVVFAMTLLLIQRIRHTSRERAALATEMLAAQEIQRILVPSHIDTGPQIRAQAVFLPAQEVGGDFYRCRVLSDGTQWLLLGDVSGKGTAAGMTGCMLLGASEGHEHHAPAHVLAHLNQVLCASGVGGLTTCLCARLSPDGVLTLANAGHLPPYRNGSELDLEGGLPLGLTPAAAYHEARVQLQPEDILTFLSDGVVEAQSPDRELFGFERARGLATQSAHQIAEAARQFGQQDDITVLSLTFEPAPQAMLRV